MSPDHWSKLTWDTVSAGGYDLFDPIGYLDRKRDRAYKQRVIVTPAKVHSTKDCIADTSCASLYIMIDCNVAFSVAKLAALGCVKFLFLTCVKRKIRVANSHAYGVILTHLTCYSRTHAIDKFTHAFKRNHTHTHAIL